jgi:vitamin B12 transporter
MRIALLAAAAVAAALAAPARAQDAADPGREEPAKKAETSVPPMEVVATGFAEEPGRSTLVIDVIDGKWFEDHQVASVAEGLRQIPGLTVARGGTAGAATSIFLRGAASNQVLVLQDGMPLNDPTLGGQFNFFDLDALNLGRVEVLRGSYGALYGSNAIGGVINLVSRRGEGPGTFELSLEGGSFLSHRETFTGSGGDESADWSFGVANTGTDGPHDRQAFRSRSFSGLFGAEVAGDGRAEVAIRWLDSTAEDPYDFGNPLPKDDNIRRERQVSAIGLTFEKPLARILTFKGRASVTDADSSFRNGGDTPGAVAEFESLAHATTTFGGASVKADFHDDLSVVGGVDGESETSNNFSESPFGAGNDIDGTTRNAGAYVLVRAAVGPVSVDGGGRYDDHSQAGSEWSPQVGARLDIERTRTVLRGNYGQGFRAPTPSEFADPFVGNPDLVPESSQSVDAGFEQRLGEAVTVEGTWFRLRTEDLIAFDPATFLLGNISRTETEGYEVGASAKVGGGVVLRGSYTKQFPRNLVTGGRLPNRPDAFASGGAEWTRGKWTFTADAYWQSDVDDLGQTGPDQDLRDHPGRRFLLNVGARFRVNESITVFARVENALNEEYVETPTAPKGAPVAVFAGVTLGF